MPKDIHVPARIIGGKIPVKASLGQTVIVTEGPETYTGPVTVTPTTAEQVLQTKDKLLTDNVTVGAIPSEYTDAKADYEDALLAFGVEDNLADGITALTTYSNSVTGEQDENLSDAVRSLADGYNPDGLSIDSIADGTGLAKDITITLTEITANYTMSHTPITGVFAPNLVRATGNTIFTDCTNLNKVSLPNLEVMGSGMFQMCRNLAYIWLPKIKEIRASVLYGRNRYPSTLDLRIGNKPDSINSLAFNGCSQSGNIYVCWGEGEISGAPWGAPSAVTIHYNTVFDSEGNIIS